MGREVRRVPADWQHPRDARGHYLPLHEGPFNARVAAWDEANAKWNEGLRSDYEGGWQPIGDVESTTYAEWDVKRPKPQDYMPEFPDGTATHYMMYETCSEGTPISPAFTTPEELAHWLSDNAASSFGSMTASYDSWLRVCNGGYAPSAIMDANGLRSGVEL